MNKKIIDKLLWLSIWLSYTVPMHLRADFLGDVTDSVFDDPDDDAGLLTALTNATSWATAIFTFIGVLFLFGAWFELKKKDTGAVVYTLGAVGGFFMTPLIVRTLKSLSDF